MTKREIKLGQRVKDKVTGIKGIVVSHVKFLNGCNQLGVQQDKLDKDGCIRDLIYLDIEQADIVDDGISIVKSDAGGIKSASQYPKKRI